jgi:hypothetical protein
MPVVHHATAATIAISAAARKIFLLRAVMRHVAAPRRAVNLVPGGACATGGKMVNSAPMPNEGLA